MMKPPSLKNPVADAENLIERIETLGPTHVDTQVLKDLSTRLREWNWNLTAHIRNRELVAVSLPKSRPMGLAVDLGSTKMAGFLIDLGTGEKIASKGIMNPQISKGEDIITRINVAIRSSKGRTLMVDLAREGLMKLAADLCAEASAETGDILDAVIVGNTAMHHMILGLPVRQLALSPFVPAVRRGVNVKARDMGLDFAAGAYVYFPPNIAGFVGADHVASLTATAAEWDQGYSMVIDIGTNTEISLLARGKITSVSCASGPAFEGYHIRDGVRASSGAIEKVSLWGGRVSYKAIDDAEPVGICGSGILDAVSQLYLAGILNRSGRMLEGSHSRVVKKNGRLEFILVPRRGSLSGRDISITQKDVREVQLGKAAIQAAIKILVDREGISETEMDKIFIAGAFGSYIDISNAIAIGMMPSLPLNRFHQVGNGASAGARHFLLSSTKRNWVEELILRIEYLELAGTPEFGKAFTQACLLEPYYVYPNAGRD